MTTSDNDKEFLIKMVETVTRVDQRTEHIAEMLVEHKNNVSEMDARVRKLEDSKNRIMGIAIILPTVLSVGVPFIKELIK